MNPVFKFFRNRAARAGRYLEAGMMNTVGAEPLEIGKDVSLWSWRGRELALEQGGGRIGAKFTGATHGAGWWEDAITFGQMAGTAMVMGEGYAYGGAFGAVAAGFSDLAVNSAMVRHGYKYKRLKGGNLKVIGPKSFLGGMWQLGTRYAGGTVGAAIGRGMLGGGIAGMGGALVGGYAGVKHPFLLAGGYLGYHGAKLIGNATAGVLKAGYQHKQRQKMIDTSGSMAAFHTQGAHTMRQRAVQAIHKNHLNARSALGHEAQFMHFPSKNYHSRYRAGY